MRDGEPRRTSCPATEVSTRRGCRAWLHEVMLRKLCQRGDAPICAERHAILTGSSEALIEMRVRERLPMGPQGHRGEKPRERGWCDKRG